VLARLLTAYRRTGADLPFGDPWPAHGVLMEGYYWRFTDPAAGRVLIVLCGVSRSPTGSWAAVAMAAHPGGHVWMDVAERAEAGAERVSASTPLHATRESLEVDFGTAASLHARLTPAIAWPHRGLGALGPGHLLPRMPQYWHPHLLTGRASGQAVVEGVPWDLSGFTAYSEKNWGGDFPGHWWWGQAHGFEDPDVCVAFAGGRVHGVAPSAAVVALPGGRVHRFPLVRATDGGWTLRGPGLTIEGEAAGEPHLLPVPVSAERRVDMRSTQYLAARMQVTLSRRGRTLFRGESRLAGLERGRPASPSS
jgi:hypothetical protein